MAQELTQARLKELLHYDPETGVFTRIVGRRGNTRVGAVAGWLQQGYIHIKVDNRDYMAHRLAWLFMHGSMPEFEVDHINRVRNDNRVLNLRAATASENAQNRSFLSRNTSGHTGVYIDKRHGYIFAAIGHKGKLIHLGTFGSVEEAVAARKCAKESLHTFNPTIERI